VNDREGRVSGEALPEDSDDAFIRALLGPRPEPREMTPEQSERLDRRFYAMLEEQRRAGARRRRHLAIAGTAVAVVAVGAGAGLALGRRSFQDSVPASALARARALMRVEPPPPAPRGSAGVNGGAVPRR
jgi:hypothetical protein